ncbi:hypothetical protein Pyrfu_0885 [Pyrolobus fumarii 1A]|uniref:Uncharacterized protein n=1 Tax=Pyrolobus fumarii (strain DSM 11204 / 1A) TaxID=694429 RepID=G0EE60_PYRF1|nr:hypothetical protein [Pyrolobus fumarii]AEM38754.1 hypothetical protein Pyrfu_0885 [Pyrolobus fumarii 1A]
MPGLALLASKTEPSSDVLDALSSCRGCEGLLYLEERNFSSVMYAAHLDPLEKLGWIRRGVYAVSVSDWICGFGLTVLGGHALAWLMVCTPTVTRNMLVTASPPDPLRRSKRAIVQLYTQRLVREGSSTERIAAKLVHTGGSPAAMIAVIAESGARRTPVLIMAAKRMCVSHHGRWAAVATHSLPKCTLLEDKVATLKLQGGVPRVEIRSIQDVVR